MLSVASGIVALKVSDALDLMSEVGLRRLLSDATKVIVRADDAAILDDDNCRMLVLPNVGLGRCELVTSVPSEERIEQGKVVRPT